MRTCGTYGYATDTLVVDQDQQITLPSAIIHTPLARFKVHHCGIRVLKRQGEVSGIDRSLSVPHRIESNRILAYTHLRIGVSFRVPEHRLIRSTSNSIPVPESTPHDNKVIGLLLLLHFDIIPGTF